MSCTCGRIHLGVQNKIMGLNWHPDCAEHGTESEWWNSEEQRTTRTERQRQLIEMQKRAREASPRSERAEVSPRMASKRRAVAGIARKFAGAGRANP